MFIASLLRMSGRSLDAKKEIGCAKNPAEITYVLRDLYLPIVFASVSYAAAASYDLRSGVCSKAGFQISKSSHLCEFVAKSGADYEMVISELNSQEFIPEGNANKNSDDYLDDRVSFSEDKIMDAESKAVMMAWEKPLMEAHAKAVCSNGGHVLNVGFGMGLVDTAIQQYAPASHTIIEAHPEVYDRMIRQGWDKKDNVKIIFGRWQDVVSQLESYDGIFFDTYGEYYEDMREFHQYLPKLLKPGGIYSFFNGLCGGNPFFHVVYCQLVSLDLGSMGYSTQLIPLPVKDCLSEEIWEGVKHKYWQLDTYYLPVCQSTNESD
nr:protein arginine N-methyltransferase 2 [Ipomoea batatas]